MTSSDAFYMVGRMSVLIVSQESWISENIYSLIGTMWSTFFSFLLLVRITFTVINFFVQHK